MGVGFGAMSGPARRASIQRQRLLFLGGSVFLFVVLVLGAVFLTQSQSVARSNVSVESQDEVTLGTVVLIAANSKIPKGTKITAANIREVHWPRDQVPEGAARTLEDVDNMFASATLPENQPILRSALSSTAPSLGIDHSLPPGHRAITINVTATTGVEGWATAGAHVDVLLTYLDPKDGVSKTIVVVENAVVLSFGGNAKTPDRDDSSRGSPASEISTATLDVQFTDSLKIQTALAMGRITLALRGKDDVTSPGGNAQFDASQFNQPKRVAPAILKKDKPKGFAKFTGPGGTEHEYTLGSDDRWQNESQDGAY